MMLILIMVSKLIVLNASNLKVLSFLSFCSFPFLLSFYVHCHDFKTMFHL